MHWTRLIGCPVAGVAAVCLTTGCVIRDSKMQTTGLTSLLDFLYPKVSEKTLQPTIPTLNLPLRVGLAWVPMAVEARGHQESSELPAQFLEETLGKVRNQFTNLPFGLHGVLLMRIGEERLMEGAKDKASGDRPT